MSRYSNYVIKNNVFAELDTPVSSLGTVIQLKDGQGARWGSDFPILATLESKDNSGKITKREIVRITSRSGDNLTVVRGVAPCPPNDDSDSQGTTTFSFQADDIISLYITKEHFDNIEAGFENTNDEIDDLHDNGTDELRTYKTTGLGVEIKPGKVLVGTAYVDYEGGTLTLTDNATNYIEIDEDGNLQTNTTGRTEENAKISKVITSGGQVSSIEDRRLGTVGGRLSQVNIHELTEKTLLDLNDEFLVADSENCYQNKKVKFGNMFTPFGNGCDGCCVIDTDTTLEAKEYQFTELHICCGVKVDFCGGGVPIIRACDCIINEGEINLRGFDVHKTSGIFSLSSGEVITIGNVPSCEIPQCGGCGGSGSINLGAGGNGGAMGCNGAGGEYYGCQGGAGGTGSEFAGGGGGGGGSYGAQGGDGGNASLYIGGNGGRSPCGSLPASYGSNGGGGGYGLCGGGNGGAGYNCGGNGGDSCYGNGGNGGAGDQCRGGNGGNSVYGNGGAGGSSVVGIGGNGGIGICGGGGGQSLCNTGGIGGFGFVRGGDGGMGDRYQGGGGGDGGDGGNGGYGCCIGGNGGNAVSGTYGIGLFSPHIENCCICARGGNGGNGGNSSYGRGGSGGNGTDGGEVHILYDNCIIEGSIDVSGGCAGGGGPSSHGTAGTPGTAGKDGLLHISKFTY